MVVVTTPVSELALAREQVEETVRADALTIDNLVLDGMTRRVGRKRITIKQRVDWSLTDAVIERTIEGASTLTLTINDPEWVLMDSGIFDADEYGDLDPIDVRVDKLWFRIVAVNPEGDTLTLTFEDREVAMLRRHTKPRSVSRADKTRAQFIEMLVREVKAVRIKYHSPEKTIRQDVAKPEKAQATSSTGSRSRGLHRSQRLTIKGKTIDAGQRRNIEQAMRGADKEKAKPKARLALVIAAIAEGEFRTNATNPKSNAKGPWQLLPSTSASIGIRHTAIEKTARYFLAKGFTGIGGAITLSRKRPEWSAGDIANAVEGGGAGAGFYMEYADEGRAILKAWGDGALGDDETTSKTRIKQYRFRRGQDGKREDSWATMQRLASEVNWRCFMRSGEVWYASEPYLLKQRALAVISRTTEGIDSSTFGFRHDTAERVKELSFDCHASRWSFPPGAVIVVEKSGTANGRWLVAKISRSLFDPKTSITLKRATNPKKEPAPETVTTTDSGSSDGSATGKVYSKAYAISRKNMPYVWGGGHAKAGTPSAPHAPLAQGYDCSGYVAACLVAGGMLPDDWKKGVPASGEFARSYGKSGKGEGVTVWANSGHVFIEFHIDGKKGKYADTSRQAGGAKGPHIRYGRRSTAGFTPRHWPGA